MEIIQVKIHENSFLPKLFSLFAREDIYGVTIGRHVYLKGRKDDYEPYQIWHEIIHVSQYEEHGIFGFFWQYNIKEMFVKYRDKTFEKEAYGYQYVARNYLRQKYPNKKFIKD